MRALNKNLLVGATITATTAATGYSFTDMVNDSRLCRVGRSTTTSLVLHMDLLTAQNCTYFAILNHNITDTATVTLEYSYDNSSWTSRAITIYTTTTYNRITPEGDTRVTSTGDTRVVTVDTPYESICEVNPAPFARYWRLTITDTKNTDGYIEMGMVYLGDYIQLPNMAPDQQIPRRTNSDKSFNETRQVQGYKKVQYIEATVNFPFVSDAELASCDLLFAENNITDPFILLVWANNLDVQPPIYCVIEKLSEPKRNGTKPTSWNMSLSFTECK